VDNKSCKVTKKNRRNEFEKRWGKNFVVASKEAGNGCLGRPNGGAHGSKLRLGAGDPHSKIKDAIRGKRGHLPWRRNQLHFNQLERKVMGLGANLSIGGTATAKI